MTTTTPRSMTRTQFATLRAQQWFDAGWCAAAAADVLTHPGSDTAKVRQARRLPRPGTACAVTSTDPQRSTVSNLAVSVRAIAPRTHVASVRGSCPGHLLKSLSTSTPKGSNGS